MPQLELPARAAHVFYLDQGAGTPTLFLHGNPDSAEVWRAVIAGLPGLRCIAPDLPGFGRTTVRADYPYTLEHMADFSIELLYMPGRCAAARRRFPRVTSQVEQPAAITQALREFLTAP